MIVMVVGAILVVALVAWALTRSVQPNRSVIASDTPASAPSTATSASAFPASTDTGTFTAPPPGSGSAHPPQDPAKAQVGRISAEDLRARVNRGEVTVIDVRDANSFASSHIPGAIHIPFSSIEASLSEIPKNKPIVTYCT
jgi:hypothetical protein